MTDNCNKCDRDHLYRRDLSEYMTAEIDTDGEPTLKLEVADWSRSDDDESDILFYPREFKALREFEREVLEG